MLAKTTRLTETYVKRLGLAKPGQTYVVRDDDLGGFHLRVSPKAKVFKLHLNVRDGGKHTTRGFSLGRYPKDIDCDGARREARRIITLRDNGKLEFKLSPYSPKEKATGDAASNPLSAIPHSLTGRRIVERTHYEADRDNDNEAYKAALSGARARNISAPESLTLVDAWILYKDFSLCRGRENSTIAAYSDLFKRYLTTWLAKPLRSITAADVRNLRDDITDGGKAATANNVVTAGRAVYNYALRGLRTPGLDPLSPWIGPGLMNKIRARQTGVNSGALSDWHTEIIRLSPILRAANEFALLSNLRLKNFRSLRWDQVSVEQRCAHIRSTKSGVDFKMPLSQPMIDCLHRAREASRLIHESRADIFVFASDKSASGHIMDLKNPNAKIHAPMSSHALRHTWRVLADEARIPATHSKILMNHAVPSDVHSEYLTIDSMFDQLRASQDAVSALIMRSLSSGKTEMQDAA
jgi:integrase